LINFTGRIDGEAFDGGAMEGHQLVLGSGTFIPGFEDQLIGTKAGDKLDVTVTFPEDYQAADLSGKEAVFETEVLEVQGAEDAKIDDDFASKFGMDSLDKLKDVMKEQVEAEFAGQSRMKLKRAILDEKDAGQLDDDDSAKSDDELEADYKKIAERRVRLGLVLAEMGQNAEIQISNEELQQAMIAEARRYPGQEQQVIEFYQKNPQAIAQLRAPIFEEKVVDLIVEKATIADKTVKEEVLFEEDAMI